MPQQSSLRSRSFLQYARATLRSGLDNAVGDLSLEVLMCFPVPAQGTTLTRTLPLRIFLDR